MNEKGSPEFKPRSDLRRTLAYRPILRFSFYVSLVIQWMAATYFLVDSLLMIRTGAPIGVKIPLLLSVIFLVWFAYLHFVLQPILETVIHLNNTGLTFQRGRKRESIAFGDIEKVLIPSQGLMKHFMPGLFILRAKGKNYFFTVAIERSEYILEMVCSSRPDLVQQNDIYDLRFRALLMDHQWARIQEGFGLFPHRFVLKFVVVPSAQTLLWFLFSSSASLQRHLILQKMTFFTGLATAIGFLMFMTKVIYFSKIETSVLQANPQAVIRDIEAESRVQSHFEKAYWAILLLVWINLILFQIFPQ